jgi:hypothetical protein
MPGNAESGLSLRAIYLSFQHSVSSVPILMQVFKLSILFVRTVGGFSNIPTFSLANFFRGEKHAVRVLLFLRKKWHIPLFKMTLRIKITLTSPFRKSIHLF